MKKFIKELKQKIKVYKIMYWEMSFYRIILFNPIIESHIGGYKYNDPRELYLIFGAYDIPEHLKRNFERIE